MITAITQNIWTLQLRTTDVVFITHIMHLRNMRSMKNICCKDTKNKSFCFFTIGAGLKENDFTASKIGATFKGKNLLPLGANSFL